MKIHVGNLSSEITEDDIRQAFEKTGKVDSVTITKNKYNGKLKVFAYVVMDSNEEGKSAIDSLNNQEIKGKILKVSEALTTDTEGPGGKVEGSTKAGFGGGKRGSGAKGEFGGGKGYNSSKGGFGGKKDFSGGRGGRGR
ncbi:glycine-rich RNA-binding protein 8 [Candidatus Scalindua japonica]|uniref:Glycine-rich RNA-binding protein 8 n=1 Tax=Candidatus Scalindua japonica TaxID=1284222 RepID=A0A286TYI8_9BACT|nr:RNA-binding protein [Candidatus Scalindua japonica]GAX60969.1 glycine-rich RNA-binding protein 8 [Candidatus Scalindua japonica]